MAIRKQLALFTFVLVSSRRVQESLVIEEEVEAMNFSAMLPSDSWARLKPAEGVGIAKGGEGTVVSYALDALMKKKGGDCKAASVVKKVSNEDIYPSSSMEVRVERDRSFFYPVDKNIPEVKWLKEFAGHPNIVRMYDWWPCEMQSGYAYRLHLLEEHAVGGDVELNFKKMTSGWIFQNRTKEAKLFKILMYDTLNGLSEMHRRKVLHRDIKPANILVASKSSCLEDSSCRFMFGDLGVAYQLPNQISNDPNHKLLFDDVIGVISPPDKPIGTAWWQPPEAHRQWHLTKVGGRPIWWPEDQNRRLGSIFSTGLEPTRRCLGLGRVARFCLDRICF